ncbi:MAG: capsule biosynthesis protein [Pseudomonadota bacterium]
MNAPTTLPAKPRKRQSPAQPRAEAEPIPTPAAIPLSGVPRRRRRWRGPLMFLLCVMVPWFFATEYLYLKAADQYASTLAFSVRSGTGPQASQTPDLMGALSSGSTPLMATESYVVYDYLRSQQIVEAVNGDLDLYRVFTQNREDWVFSLGPNATIEDLTRYWDWQVPVVYDTLSGIVSVEVRSFDRESATAIAQSILKHSSALVNEISRAAREDTVGFAKAELARAGIRLSEIRGQIREYRELEQKANAQGQLSIATDLIGSLESELAEARVDLKLAESYTRENDPRILRLTNKIEVLEERIAEERRRFGAGNAAAAQDQKSLADLLGDFEELEVEREFAETAYTNAMAGLQTANADARRTQRYLAVHIQPTKAEAASYPQRPLLSAMAFGALVLIWGVGTLVLTNLRDRG